MIKKKMPEMEEPSEKQQSKTADNKETNFTMGPAGTDTDKAPSKATSVDQAAESPVSETPPPDKVVPPEETIEVKLAEMQDKYLRLSAEFDNYRKRTLREKMELSKYASENIFIQILPFLDDLERAISHIEAATDFGAVKEGIDLIHVKFTEFLRQNGITEIESLNCPFNFDLHDAVAKIPVQEEEKKGKVLEVMQKGYYLLDKVIRHSKVVVGE